ncbi:restriction endonuclease subunit S [Paenibacillus protaetiae]|nr:restriction endonuclease subunit S [Paenibacillus protaetiae]
MSQEELLKKALVPVEEQPYEVPGNWVWVRLGGVTNFIDYRGKTPNKTDSGIPLITAKNVRMNKLNDEPREYISANDYDSWMTRGIPNPGDVLFTTEAPLGNVTQLTNKGKVALAQRIITIQSLVGNNTFLKYLLMSPQIQSEILSQSTGTTVQGIKASKLKLQPIPFPPLNEQKRIADKVDRLLDKINQAKQLIEEAKATFEFRRAAILDKAFRGELTKKWREESFGSAEQNWEITTIGAVCSESFYGPRFGKNEYSTEGIPTIRTTDMTKNGEIILKDPPKVIIEEKNIEKFRLKKGDLLITRTGSIGTMAVFNEEYLAVPSAYLIRFRFIEQVNTRYMFYYLMSPKGQKMMGLGTTAITQPNINAETIKKMPFILPSFEEQIEIVQVLDSFWHMEQKLINRFEKYDYLNKLEQSILMSAFSGKLGTNDVNDSKPIV